MSGPRYWLPEASEQPVQNQLKALTLRCESGDVIAGPLRGLINENHRLRSLERIGSFVTQNADSLRAQGFEQVSLGITSNASLKLLERALVGLAAGYGIVLKLSFSDFDQAFQLANTPDDPFFETVFDAILHAPFTQGLKLPVNGFHQPDQTADLVESLTQRLKHEVQGLAKNGGCTVLLQNLTPTERPMFGHNEMLIEGTQAHALAALNQQINLLARQNDCQKLDVMALLYQLGQHGWFDQRNWHMAKYPFTENAAILYCDLLARRCAAMKGKSRRALVIDLDNTLWGGVIGDDGLDGIVLGQGSADGEAFQDLQSYIKALSQRGVALAICSKNTDHIAREPFQAHDEMILQEDDIAVFVANWTDKASNIRQIAETMSLGLDAFVFIDDNPAEREQVRKALPLVMVPEFGSDPTHYVDILSSGGFFELPELSQADRERNAQYVANARRSDLAQSASDMGGYLQSLGMVGQFRPFDAKNLKRITQLINKTNQFNLTTRRYTEQQTQTVLAAEGTQTGFFVRLADKFGDNGLISVIILDTEVPEDAPAFENSAYIDTWLMSCRVLGRQTEEFIMTELAQYAQSQGIEYLVGHYIATPRNGMVSELYPRLGFEAHKDGFFYVRCSDVLSLTHYISRDVP